MRTNALAARAHEIQTTGLTGAYEKIFKDLEEKLAQAQGIVNARNATAAAVSALMELTEDLRYCMAACLCDSDYTYTVVWQQWSVFHDLLRQVNLFICLSTKVCDSLLRFIQ